MSQGTQLQTYQQPACIANIAAQNIDVTYDINGATAHIDGTDYPIFEQIMTLSVVQNGTVASDPAKYKGRGGQIHVTPEDPDDMNVNFAESKLLLPVCVIGTQFQMYEPYSKNKTNNQPLCKSDKTGTRPSLFSPNKFSDRCAEYKVINGKVKETILCPKAQWTVATDGTRVKPECNKVVILGFLDISNPDFPTPVNIYLKGTGLRAWTEFDKTYTFQKGMLRRRGANLAEYAIRLSTADKGTYYEPEFKLVHVDNLNLEKISPLIAYYRDNVFTSTQQGEDNDFPEVEEKLAEANAEIAAIENITAMASGSESGDLMSDMDDVPF